MDSEYAKILQNLMDDVFLNLFNIQPIINFTENIQGPNKKYIDFFQKACDFKPMIQFPIYINEDECHRNENIIGYTCD